MARGRPVKCPYCGSTETRLKGFRKTVSMGPRRIRRCVGCKRRFTARQAGNSAKVVLMEPKSIATQLNGEQRNGELNHGDTNDLQQMRDTD